MSLILAAIVLAQAPITIDVGNIRNDRGRVHVSLCPKERFLAEKCTYEGSAPAHAGITQVTVNGVPPGEYAAQSFHDENGNNEVDRGFLGIPKEGVGFSRDARIVLSPPKWKDAVFSHEDHPQAIRFNMHYMTGPGSPEAWHKAHPGR